MAVYVVDSSVAVKWFFPELHSAQALRCLDDAHTLHAPDLLLLEFDNVLCKRLRRGQIVRRTANRIRAGLRDFPVAVQPSVDHIDGAFDLAAATGRSLYDCVFLALALALGARMVTADRRFFDELRKGPLAEYLCWVGDLPD